MSAEKATTVIRLTWRRLLQGALVLGIAIWTIILARAWSTLDINSSAIVESTPGQLALWLSEQAEEEEPESLLGQYAQSRLGDGENSEQLAERLLAEVRTWLSAYALVIGLLALGFSYLLWRQRSFPPFWLMLLLLAQVINLFIYSPATHPQLFYSPVAMGWLLLLVIVIEAGSKGRLINFFVLICTIFLIWEMVKLGAESLEYRITRPLPTWDYSTYPDLPSALDALAAGELAAVVADRNQLDDLMPAYPANPRRTEEERDALPRQGLRYARIFDRTERFWFFPIEPNYLPRLTIAVRAEDEGRLTASGQLHDLTIATDRGSYADERFLSKPREMVLLNFRIFNDLNLPHLQNIARAFTQPARRNGPFLLISILSSAAFFTLSEAVLGFAFGAALGFVLGTVFAHSPLLERSLLPYVVASQTVPILAFAPMVVIWLGASAVSVAVIAAYLTFFPVTINTLRGLLSPSPTALELMRSYAASRMETLWKLRIPAALPYFFTALKVSATASVVGAIIGELPSGISDGLGRAILNFSSDYSMVSTPKLWASIVSAAAVGIIFFVSVTLVEWRVLRNARRID